MIRVDVTKGSNNYYFTTHELVKICTLCKRTFKIKKYCTKCSTREEKVPTVPYTKERVGKINISNLKDYMCSCFYSSTLMYSPHWEQKKKEEKKGFCKHYRAVIKKIREEKQNGNHSKS